MKRFFQPSREKKPFLLQSFETHNEVSITDYAFCEWCNEKNNEATSLANITFFIQDIAS